MTDTGSFNDRRRANLARTLNPRSLMFMGGERFVAPSVRAVRRAGYDGDVFVVNRNRDEIEGAPCTPSIADLPIVPDASFICVPADATIEAVRELNELGAAGAVCFASGFAEAGETGRARDQLLRDAAGDMAIVGPNCFGIINYVTNGSLWPVPYIPSETAKGAAIIAQSGNVCINLSMNQRSVPFSYIVSVGNQTMLSFADYIDFLVDDEHVTAIGLFLEGLRDIPRFAAACIRAWEKRVPIVAFRVGVSELGAKLAATHTSSLAGQNELYDTLFDRLGIMQAASVPQFQELLKIASLGGRPKGRRLAVFSSSGGDNGMSADYTSGVGLDIAPLGQTQIDTLRPMFPDFQHIGNPLDFTSQYWGVEDGLYEICKTVLSEGYDQGLMVIDHPLVELGEGHIRDMRAMVSAMGRACKACGVPGAVSSVNPESIPDIMRTQIVELGMTPLQGLHDAGPVLGMWTQHCLRDPASSPVAPLAATTFDETTTLDEAESKRRLSEAGIPIPRGLTGTIEDLAASAAVLRRPLALKGLHEKLPHKTEAGAVVLNLDADANVRAAAEDMIRSVSSFDGSLTLDRFLLEEMGPSPVAELMVGVQRDPQFGFVLVLAAGGIMVELMRDAARLLLPFDADDVRAALRSLKAYPLLDGYRGRPKGDVEALVDAVLGIGRFVEANADTLVGLDVNPLFVYPEGEGVLAVDALIVETAAN